MGPPLGLGVRRLNPKSRTKAVTGFVSLPVVVAVLASANRCGVTQARQNPAFTVQSRSDDVRPDREDKGGRADRSSQFGLSSDRRSVGRPSHTKLPCPRSRPRIV